MTAEQLKLYQLRKKHVSEEKLATDIQPLLDQTFAVDKFQQVWERTRTPVEKVRKELDEMVRARNLGAFTKDPETFRRGMKAIDSELKELQQKAIIPLNFEYKGLEAGTWEDITQIEEQMARIQATALSPEQRAAMGEISAERYRVGMESGTATGVMPATPTGWTREDSIRRHEEEAARYKEQQMALDIIAANTDPKNMIKFIAIKAAGLGGV